MYKIVENQAQYESDECHQGHLEERQEGSNNDAESIDSQSQQHQEESPIPEHQENSNTRTAANAHQHQHYDSISIQDLKAILQREKSLLHQSRLSLLSQIPYYQNLKSRYSYHDEKIRKMEDYIEVMSQYKSQMHDSAQGNVSAAGESHHQEEDANHHQDVESLQQQETQTTAAGRQQQLSNTTTTASSQKSNNSTPVTSPSAATSATRSNFTSHRDSLPSPQSHPIITTASASSSSSKKHTLATASNALELNIKQQEDKLRNLKEKKLWKLQLLQDLQHQEEEGHQLLSDQVQRSEMLLNENTVLEVALQFSKMENDILRHDQQDDQHMLRSYQERIEELNQELLTWKNRLTTQNDTTQELQKQIDSDQSVLQQMQKQVDQMSLKLETQNLILNTFRNCEHLIIREADSKVIGSDPAHISLLKNPSSRKLFIDISVYERRDTSDASPAPRERETDSKDIGSPIVEKQDSSLPSGTSKLRELLEDDRRKNSAKANTPTTEISISGPKSHICCPLTDVGNVSFNRTNNPKVFSLFLKTYGLFHFKSEEASTVVQCIQDLLGAINGSNG